MTDENQAQGAMEWGDAGDARVDGILALLDELDDKPVVEHAELYLEVHSRLSGELNPRAAARRSGAHGSA